MAALDFPNAPAVGEVYSANGVSYQWDGNFWQANNAGAAGGLPEAPIDGKSYGRKDTFWSEVVSIALHNSDKAAQATKDQTQDSLLASHGTAIANMSWSTLSGKPSTFPPSAHQHPISDVQTLQTTLDGKAPTVHTHPQTDITNLVQDLGLKAPLASPVFTGVPQGPTAAVGVANTQLATTAFVKSLGYATTVDLTAALAGKENTIATGPAGTFWANDKTWKAVPAAGIPEAPLDGEQYARQSGAWTVVVATGGGGGSVAWADITGKPATFPPTVPIAWADVSGKPATFPPTLPIAQSGVTNLVSDLALKAPLASPALTGTPTAPTALGGDSSTKLATTAFVTGGLATGLATKANVVHTHVIADVTNLQTSLDGKASTMHTHIITDVTGLQSQLDLKAPLASPVFTGNPTAPTPSLGDNDTSLATTAFVVAAIAAAPSGAVSVSETPPASPKDNTFWFDNGTGALALRYNDGNSSAYVQVNGAGINDAPRDGQQYMRQDGGWSIAADTGGDYLPLTGGTLSGGLTVSTGNIVTLDNASGGFFVYSSGSNVGYLSPISGVWTNPSGANANGGVSNGKGSGAGFLGYMPGGSYYGGLGYASYGFYSNYLCYSTGYRGGDFYISGNVQTTGGVGIFGGTNTTASSANCNITTGGGLYRSTASTRAVKRDIEPMWDEIADKILSLPTYWHRYAIQQKEPDYFSVYSLMAEDCAAADPRFANWDKAVVYDENGAMVPKYEVQDVVNPDHAPWISQPEHMRSGEGPPLFIKQEVQVGFELAEEDSPQHVNWNALVTGLINIVQRQEARIAALEAANAPV